MLDIEIKAEKNNQNHKTEVKKNPNQKTEVEPSSPKLLQGEYNDTNLSEEVIWGLGEVVLEGI